jgi:hypothetical protein
MANELFDVFASATDRSEDSLIFRAPLDILVNILGLRREAEQRVAAVEDGGTVDLHGNHRLFLGRFSVVFIAKAVR